MDYQLSDLITSVQQRAKDTSFSSSLITEYLNEVQSEVLGHRRYSFMETSDTDTLSASSGEIELDEDIQTIHYLAIDVSGQNVPLKYVPQRTFYRDVISRGETQPWSFTFIGRTIYFSNPADQAYTITLHYTRRPAKLENVSDEPEIPEDYREILMRGSLARIEEYRGNYDIAAIHQRKVEELTEDMNLRYGLRWLGSAPKMPRRSFRNAAE